ncbi:LysR family transcriptional regulator [Maritimibacter dapengensis]|uniref:LysR family transcriptional regulator n=1 Tax=Maritimibacter dapengensis TaxID=2836868 RepID=A0ABS6T5U9_9RHOB|nr:LysR family transcriptional regulator [Maritimibacter dapengensis]MBV7380622.1 LysR family transcriptional regulator [Maritimibacter dapengensis]
MRFKGLDLNLLVALDILLTEKNVSRAAEKLFLSQSATSGALARLRDYFDDELLVQVGRKMVLTPRATALAGKVRAALVQIDGTIIQAPGFDPATVQRTIRIIASDFITISCLRSAVRNIGREAPGLVIDIQQPAHKPHEKIERGEVELLVMPELYVSPDHPSERVFSDGYVVVAWEGNTTHGTTITEAEFFAAQHATVMFETHTPSYEAWFIKNRSANERKLAVIAGSFSALPFLIEGTEYLALMHRSMAEIFAAQMPLRIIPCPIDIPELVEAIQWHTYSDSDECLAWVREKIMTAARNS